jgi:hypothetical protein
MWYWNTVILILRYWDTVILWHLDTVILRHCDTPNVGSHSPSNIPVSPRSLEPLQAKYENVKSRPTIPLTGVLLLTENLTTFNRHTEFVTQLVKQDLANPTFKQHLYHYIAEICMCHARGRNREYEVQVKFWLTWNHPTASTKCTTYSSRCRPWATRWTVHSSNHSRDKTPKTTLGTNRPLVQFVPDLSREYSGQNLKLISPISCQRAKLRNSGDIPLLPPHAFMVWRR